MEGTFLFTSESVSEGHPDKVCDLISDSILDAALSQDRQARVACETLVKDNTVVLGGEITSTAYLDYEQIVRSTIAEIGYQDPDLGFNSQTCEINCLIGEQSPDIALGVDSKGGEKEQGAGDQGMMFGYASDETGHLMPAPIDYAHRLMLRHAEMRRRGEVSWLCPDAKSQVTVRYEHHKPVMVDAVVLSTQHHRGVQQEEIRETIIERLIKPCIPSAWLDDTRYIINPTGHFVVGGPKGDCGLTGRKIIVDTYGGMARHGGGAFSGKDPSKVDRSAAYAARWIAKNLVAAGLAKRCEIQLAYAIGKPDPVSIMVNTYQTGRLSDQELERRVRSQFDLSPRGIIRELDLLRPIYKKTASYGHFGRDEFPWESCDRAPSLAQ